MKYFVLKVLAADYFCKSMTSNGTIDGGCGGTFVWDGIWCSGYPAYVKTDNSRFLRRLPLTGKWFCKNIAQLSICGMTHGQHNILQHVREKPQGLWKDSTNVHMLCND